MASLFSTFQPSPCHRLLYPPMTTTAHTKKPYCLNKRGFCYCDTFSMFRAYVFLTQKDVFLNKGTLFSIINSHRKIHGLINLVCSAFVFHRRYVLRFMNIAIQTLGGLRLFVLGMKTMTDGLQMSAGTRIKKILCALSSNRVIGCATGTLVTAMVKSSSATTVMLIGFVSAGLLTLHQAVGVILGANIGTTVTSQLIAFKLSSLALPAIALGVGMKFFSKQKIFRYTG